MTRARWLTKPDDLSPAAAAYWNHYARGLFQAEMLTPENAESFKLLCRVLATARAAADEIEKFGVTIETAAGGRKPNPACAVLFRAQQQARPLLVNFGLA
jgi:phage terminase small subunit